MRELGDASRFRLGEKGKRKRYPFIVLGVISLIMLILSRHSAEASVFEKARESILDAASPILEFFSGPIDAVSSVVGSVNDYFDVIEENRRLKSEIAELKQYQWQAQSLRNDIDQLAKLVNIQPRSEVSYVIANVIGESGGPFLNAMIVDVGRDQGVARGHAVIGDAGMIGHVITVGGSSSRVLLLSDFNSKVPVYIEGADVQAIMRGAYGRDPILEFVNDVDISGLQPGQRVITSGAGGIIPRGLPVGELSSESGTDLARVGFYANFDRVKMARVLRYRFAPNVEDNGAANDVSSRADAGARETALNLPDDDRDG